MIELALFGTPELRRSGESTEAVLAQPRRLALLAYLAASDGALVRRDRLLLLFWGDQPESRARGSLRQALYVIRRSLGDDVLVTRGDDEVGLNAAAARVDVIEFERAVGDGRAEDALALYRGDFLADFNIDSAPDFERWLDDKRRALRRSAVDGAWQLADAANVAGAHVAAIRWSRRAIDLAAYAESDVRRAMRMIAAAGDRSGALAVFETFRGRLAIDLETDPEASTSALANELRTGNDVNAPIVAPSVVAAVSPPVATRLPPRGGRNVTASLAAAMVVVAVVAATTFYRSRADTVRDSAAVGRVAVFPFTIRSRTGDAAYLREGAATLLGLALDGAGRLRVVDPNAVLAASPAAVDLEAGRRIAATLGAGQFVLGEIEAAGARLSVAATLYDGAGRSQARATAAGDEHRVFDLVDSLARRLAVSAMTDSTVRLANVAATATQSLAAFKAFLVGETNMRAGHYREAVAALRDAVASDSTFALAYYRLSLAREWTDGEISSDSAAALAERFASRLPDRDRKLLAARRAVVRRDGVEAERLTRDVLASYPTDADAWLQLGEIRFHIGPNAGRSINDAREPLLTVLRFRPNDLAARVHLTRIAARAGDRGRLGEWSGPQDALGDASEIGAFELAAMRAVVVGDARAADTVAAATRRANDLTVLATIWRVTLYTGDPDAAAAIAAQRRANGFPSQDAMTFTETARGHIAPARTGDERFARTHASAVGLMLAMPSAPSWPVLARRSHDELERIARGRSAEIVAAAMVAARLLEARYPDSLASVVRAAALPVEQARTTAAIGDAIRALAAGQASRAMELVVADRLDEPTLYRDGLYDIVASVRAEALHRLGRDPEAIAWLQSIGMNSAGSSAAIALATRRIAELEDAGGAHEAAARHWLSFARMWRSSDPELRPLVDAALAAARTTAK